MSQEIQTKKCSKCQTLQSILNFNKTKDKLRSECQTCQHLSYQKHYQLNKIQINEKHKDYNKSPKFKKYHHNWYLKNKNHCAKISYNSKKRRLKADINFRLLCNYQTCVNSAIRNNTKSSKTIELLGCTTIEFKQHLEKYFKEGMNWSNWGKGFQKWNIDHRIPLSFFNLSDPIEQKQAFHYTNCQPLWFEDNMLKSDNIIITYANYLPPL